MQTGSTQQVDATSLGPLHVPQGRQHPERVRGLRCSAQSAAAGLAYLQEQRCLLPSCMVDGSVTIRTKVARASTQMYWDKHCMTIASMTSPFGRELSVLVAGGKWGSLPSGTGCGNEHCQATHFIFSQCCCKDANVYIAELPGIALPVTHDASASPHDAQ